MLTLAINQYLTSKNIARSRNSKSSHKEENPKAAASSPFKEAISPSPWKIGLLTTYIANSTGPIEYINKFYFTNLLEEQHKHPLQTIPNMIVHMPGWYFAIQHKYSDQDILNRSKGSIVCLQNYKWSRYHVSSWSHENKRLAVIFSCYVKGNWWQNGR